MKKRIISFLVTICMMLTLISGFPEVAYAAANLNVSAGNIDINASGDYTITGSSNTNTIKVEPNITGVNITLSNVSIDVSSIDGACAFDIGDGAIVNIVLADGTTNTFKSGAYKAGIKVEAPVGQAAGSITIDGTGILIAMGGKGDSNKGSGSGIGSNARIASGEAENTIPSSGNITINNGTVQATGGLGQYYAGSGIGGGAGYNSMNSTYASSQGNTTIHGGNVIAVGGSCTTFSGSGIGGGSGFYSGNVGTVLIDGGNVTALSGNGRFIGSGIGHGFGNASVRNGVTSITIKGSACVNAVALADGNKYSAVFTSNLTVGGNAALKVQSGGTGICYLTRGSAISCNNLVITDRPEITALTSAKSFSGSSISAIYVANTNLTVSIPIISGIFASPLSTTANTDIAISGGSSTNTKIIVMPANYTSFAVTVDSIGRYTGTLGTNVLQNTGTSSNIFNLTNKINEYNLTLIAGPVNQEAPTGLQGAAPTTDANNDGKITGTTAAMEYKLASAGDNTYKACSDAETGGLASGDYLVRYAAKTGFNAGTTAAVTVNQYVEKTPPVITSVTGNPSDWTSNSVTLTVNATDAGSGLAPQAYSFDGGGTWQAGNTKTYDANTSGIVIKVKDNAGNIAAYSPIDITKIDKTAPNTAVITNAANYADSIWFNQSQTIAASFTRTDGSNEKLQYEVDSSTWTDGASVNVSDEGRHTVNFRVIDELGRTSQVQTVNVNIDKTPPSNPKITVENNEFTSFLNTITFGLFFKSTVGVTITSDSDTSGIKKVEYQKVSDASNYSPSGTWTEGSSLSVNPDEKFIIYARITDNAGNYVIINSNGVIVDATKPALQLTQNTSDWTKNNVNVNVTVSDNLSGVKEVSYTTDEAVPQSGTVTITNGEGTITLTNEGQYRLTVTAKDNSLNEISESADIKIDKTVPVISVTGNPSDWTSDSVTLTVNASDAGSGLAPQAYSFDGGTNWQTENTKTYDANTSGIVIKVKDNVGNIAAYAPIDITKIDKTAPNTAVITNASNYTDSIWFNQSQTIAASFTRTDGSNEKLQYEVNSSTWTDGASVNVSDEGRHTVNFRVIDELGRISQVQTVNVNIDKTAPAITGVSDSSSYFIGRVIRLTDGLSGIDDATYRNGTDTEKSFNDGDLFEKTGRYTLTVRDKAGNSNTLSFEIKALPDIADVVYTTDCKELIDSIRSEFNNHNDLPEPYKTDMNNEITALENRYSQLDNEVTEIKTETSTIKGKVEKLPNGIDGLLNLQKEIQNEYNSIAGNASTLTEEQKEALASEAEYLNQQLSTIATLQNQINGIKTQVSNIDTKDDGLISQEGKILGILINISKMTYEQQTTLKPQIDLLSSLLNRINTLKGQVSTVRGMINSLPSPDKITKQDADNINSISKLYNAFTNEQKELLGEDLINKLNNAVDALKKLMLYDADTDTTVTGVDGTSFDPDVYIVVTPITENDTPSGNTFMIEGENKELLALYDISLLKAGVKIEPDGRVQVKIKIPEELRGRIGLDIAHIADDGTVTPMNAVIEGDYLVFITTHFSNYAIVANPIVKGLPKTGSAYDFNSLIIIGTLISLIGIVIIRKKRRSY